MVRCKYHIKGMRAACQMFAGRVFLARHSKHLPNATVEVIASKMLLAQVPSACVLFTAIYVCKSILRKGLVSSMDQFV